jgi:hypothetical protein
MDACVVCCTYRQKAKCRTVKTKNQVRTKYKQSTREYKPPGGGEFVRTRPDRPCGTPSLLYNGYRVLFPGVKRPKSEAYSSSAEIKKAWRYTSTSSYICSWRGHFLALRIRYILFFNKIGQFTIKIFNHVTLSQVTRVTELLLIEIINVNVNNYGKFRMLDLNHKDKALFIIATEHPSSESGITNCVCAFDMVGIITRTFGTSSADLKPVRGL